jgi:subtilisin-like proprotein convertase family protein
VLYGSSSGLKASGDQLLHQDLSGFAGDVEPEDFFGETLAVGDFDSDNFDDLAVGVPGQKVNNFGNAGAVHVIYGSNNGLKAAGNKVFHQDTPGIEDDAEENESFGYALCSGDFNHDGRDDLAIASYESFTAANGEGAVHVLYGSSNGLKANSSQFWHQDKPGIADECEPNESFGTALAAGDFDHDGRDDLAIGVFENVGAVTEAGAVHVLYGTNSGLNSNGSQFWHQDKPDVNNTCETNDFYGSALAVGDFDHDGRDDLAIGVPGEDIAIPSDAVVNGIIVQLFGLSHSYPSDMDIMLEGPTGQKVMLMSDVGGDSSISNVLITIDDAGDPMPPSGEDVSSGTYVPTDYGPGDVLPGVSGPYTTTLASFNGLSPIGEWKLYINDDFASADNGLLDHWRIIISTIASPQNAEGITFGATTTPYPSTVKVSEIRDAGAVSVLYGTNSGLKSNGDQFWHRDQPSINGRCRMAANFGSGM